MSQHRMLRVTSALIIIASSMAFDFRSVEVEDDPTSFGTFLSQVNSGTESSKSLVGIPSVLFHNHYLSSAEDATVEVVPAILEHYVFGTNDIEKSTDYIDDFENAIILALSIMCFAPLVCSLWVILQELRGLNYYTASRSAGLTAIIVSAFAIFFCLNHAKFGAYLMFFGGLAMIRSAFPSAKGFVWWGTTILGLAVLFTGARHLLSPYSLPKAMTESEAQSVGDLSGTWTFDGNKGIGTWPTGQRCNLTLNRDGNGNLTITREDIGGPTVGLTAIYKGILNGGTIDFGTVTWNKPWGEQDTGSWSATVNALQWP